MVLLKQSWSKTIMSVLTLNNCSNTLLSSKSSFNQVSRQFFLLELVDRDQPTERQVRIQLKDHIDRCKKRKQEKERDDYRYSGSENEEEEPQVAGEPSSIIQAPGGDTLRRNFQQIQEGRTLVEPPPR